ncbi:MAG: ribbon-helix-helix domain-containing protein [Pseudomonadota bacterium]
MENNRPTSKGALLKRSVLLHGHATSVALEPEFWSALDVWAKREGVPTAHLLSRLDKQRSDSSHSLASTLRVACLKYATRQVDIALESGDAS